MHLLVAKELRRAQHRLDDEIGGDLPRQSQQYPRFDHRLGEECEVSGTGSRYRGYGVEIALLHLHDAADVAQHVARMLQMGVVGVLARRDPGHPLMHDRRSVRHGSDHRHGLVQLVLDRGRRDGSHDRQDRLLRPDVCRDGREERIDVLRLDREHDDLGPLDGSAVVELGVDSRASAVVLRGAPGCERSRRCPPAAANRTRARPATRASPIFPQPSTASFDIGVTMMAGKTDLLKRKATLVRTDVAVGLGEGARPAPRDRGTADEERRQTVRRRRPARGRHRGHQGPQLAKGSAGSSTSSGRASRIPKELRRRPTST